jgi:hypothetical protein
MTGISQEYVENRRTMILAKIIIYLNVTEFKHPKGKKNQANQRYTESKKKMRRTLIPGESEIHIYKNFSVTLSAVPGVVEVRGPLGVPGTSRSPSSRLSDQETVLSSPTRGACAAFFISSTLLVPFWCTVLMVRLADAVSDCWLHQSMAFHLSASPPHQLESLAAESGTTRLASSTLRTARFQHYFVFSSRSL